VNIIVPGIDPVRSQAVVEGAHSFGVTVRVGEEDFEWAFFFGHLVPHHKGYKIIRQIQELDACSLIAKKTLYTSIVN
jgi:hypothetical protein